MTIASATGTIQWQWATDAGFTTPNNIGTNSLTLPGATVGTLTADRYFRAIVTSGVCASAPSSVIYVRVDQPITTLTATASPNPVCSNNSGKQLRATQAGTNITWSWSGPAGFTAAAQNTSRGSLNEPHTKVFTL
ncbi:MAG: hypothetical protein IPH78_12680 [Bacteroidetes bacterium]|nr:hypothetical protein [Bacteroidota bacterium]